MLGREATIWVYGEGGVQLRIATPGQMRVRLLADGNLVDQRRVSDAVVMGTTLTGMRWHSLLLVTSSAGLRLGQVSF